ncbi:MAG: glycosyltransferase family 9 protein [Desulfobacterales bacterium]|nr:glycosyltransferase family 9 protein [Desulfobacterales bacterium]
MKNGDDAVKILVIRLSALGDVVRTLPAVVSISNAFPGSKITWVTETLGASFLNGHPAIHQVLVFATRLWRRIFLTPAGFIRTARQFRSFVKRLRSTDYDMVVDFHGVLKSAAVSLLAKTGRRIGYDATGTKEFSHLANTEKVSLPEGKLSRYKRNMALAEYLGGCKPNPKALIHFPSRIVGELSPFFDQLPPGGHIFAIHPGTSARAIYKRWFSDRYASLADQIVIRFNGRILFTWAPDELDFVSKIAEISREDVRIAPKTETPLHLAYILSQSDVYIGSDTGAMHMATLVGTPVVAIWGPTDPTENEPGPYSPHEVVRRSVDCSPCRKMGCRVRTCMAAVEVEDVLGAVERLLARMK